MSAIKDALRPGVEFWDAAKTLAFLADADYFQEEPAGGATDAAGSFRWPETLDKMIDNCEKTDGRLLSLKVCCDLDRPSFTFSAQVAYCDVIF